LIGFGAEVATATEVLVSPLLFPRRFGQVCASESRSLLLHGASGCGKSTLAKSLCAELQHRFGFKVFCAECPDLIHAAVGASERALSLLFHTAMESERAVIFLDQIDIICSKRDESGDGGFMRRLLSLLVMLLDETQNLTQGHDVSLDHEKHKEKGKHSLVFLAATSLPLVQLNDSFLQRFDKRLQLTPPDERAREEIWTHFLQLVPIDFSALDGKDPFSLHHLAATLAKITPEGSTGADIKAAARTVVLNLVREQQNGKSAKPAFVLEDTQLDAGKIVESVQAIFTSSGTTSAPA